MIFTIEKALYGGFDVAKDNFLTIWVNGFLAAISSILAAITIVGIVLVPAIWGGYYDSLLRIKRGEDVKIGSFFKAGFKYWGSFFILSILAVLGVVFGFLLLIVPGIYLMIAWSFFYYVKLDNPELTSYEVLGKSRALVSNRRWWHLFLLTLITGIPLAIIDSFTFELASVAFFPFVSMIHIEAYFLSLEEIEKEKELLTSDNLNMKGEKFFRSDQN